MAITDVWKKIHGVINGYLFLGFDGPKLLKNSSDPTKVEIKANDEISAAKLDVDTSIHKVIELWDSSKTNKIDLVFPDGASANRTFKFPKTQPNNGDTIIYNATTGEMQYATPGGYIATADYSVFWNSSTPITLISMIAGQYINEIIIMVTEVFDGTTPASIQIGVAGNVDKFVTSTDSKLTKLGTYIIDVKQYQDVDADMIATFTAGGGTPSTGAATIIVSYSKPA